MMEKVQLVTSSTVRAAIVDIRRELNAAVDALDALDAAECCSALERAQHLAFDAKALFG